VTGVFRWLWIGVLASNIGTWMQTVGASWRLAGEPHAATWVSLVQTATTLPVLLLALPAGALADKLDRRRLLLVVQIALGVVAAALAALTAADLMPPGLLLGFTVLLGAGQALTLPSWQAVIPDVVPHEELPRASALGAVNSNIARSVGPAIAGLLVAHGGPALVFGLNAASFAIFAAALLLWRRPDRPPARHPEHFASALRAGSRYVRYSPVVRRILLRVILFVLPGTVVQGLVPLVALRAGLGSDGYGLLLASQGIGAVAGALLMPRIRAKVPPNTLLVTSGVLYATVLAAVSASSSAYTAMVALFLAGLAWMAQVSRMNASLQLFLPGWVRARGFALYQVVFAGAQALGAVLWGQVTQGWGLPVAYGAAAVLMVLGTATVAWLPLDERPEDNSPAIFWPEPHLMLEPRPGDGPILVTARYRVKPENRRAFVAAMREVGRARQRTGASRWGIFRSGEDGDEFVEVYQVPTWEEHLRQHEGRLTGSDEDDEHAALKLVEGEPRIAHLLPPDSMD
jgi:MFS family permease